MYESENAVPAWRRYLAIRRMIVICAAVERRAEHEPVQLVVLELSPPHSEEGVLEQLADAVDVGRRASEAEVVDPHGPAIGGGDLVRALVDDLRAHVLERRQHVGQQHATGAEELAADHAPRPPRRGGRGS